MARLRESLPNSSVLMLTTYEESDLIFASLRAGASGYVSKNLPTEQLYCVLSRVLAAARYNARRLRLQRELLGAA